MKLSGAGQPLPASPAATGGEPPAPEWRVIGPLLHDGEVYGEGDVVLLAPSVAAELLACGVIEPVRLIVE